MRIVAHEASNQKTLPPTPDKEQQRETNAKERSTNVKQKIGQMQINIECIDTMVKFIVVVALASEK